MSTAAIPASLASPALYAPGPGAHPLVDRAEVLRYLGYNGQQLDDALAQRIEATIARVQRELAPRGVRRVFAVDATGLDAAGKPCIRLAGSAVVLQGRDVYRHLKDASFCVLMACTLGAESERMLRMLSSQHPTEAVVFDAACSAYAEAAVRAMDAQARQAAAACNLRSNWRFSCGYGDCPLSAQGPILAALDATRRIGLTVTQTDLLLPSKSVTALIGLFEGDAVGAADARPTCGICRVRSGCAFRAHGTTCYGGPATDD